MRGVFQVCRIASAAALPAIGPSSSGRAGWYSPISVSVRHWPTVCRCQDQGSQKAWSPFAVLRQLHGEPGAYVLLAVLFP